MKARDLMIGDWLQDKNGFPMYVTAVGTDYVYVDFDGNEGDVWEYQDRDFDDKDIQPLRLTLAMLELNGFAADGYETLMKMRFVHEFQHYLRLIGCSTKANNFKIE